MKWTTIKMLFLFCGLLFLLAGNCSTDDGKPRKVLILANSQNLMEEWAACKTEIENKFNVTLEIRDVSMMGLLFYLTRSMEENKNVPDIIEWRYEGSKLTADPESCYAKPLDDYVKNSTVISNVPKGRLSWLTLGGHLYGLPHDAHPVVLVYNDTLWKEAGVDLAKVATWDDFFAAAKKLAAKTEGGKPIHYALPAQDRGLEDTMFMMWQQTGIQIFDSSGKPDFTNPEFKTFVSKWMSWRESGVFTAWDWGNFGAYLKNGTYASYLAPDWWVSQVDQAAKEGKYRFKVRPLPVYRKGGPSTASWGGSFLAIPRTAKDPELSYKIIEYMQYGNRESMVNRYKTDKMVAPDWKVWDDPVFHQPDERFGGQKLGEIQTTIAWEIPSVNMSDVFWEALTDFGENYPEMLNKKMSVEQGLKKTQEAVLNRMR
jgi:arabinosaccharide transport system substrate-binding protein